MDVDSKDSLFSITVSPNETLLSMDLVPNDSLLSIIVSPNETPCEGPRAFQPPAIFTVSSL